VETQTWRTFRPRAALKASFSLTFRSISLAKFAKKMVRYIVLPFCVRTGVPVAREPPKINLLPTIDIFTLLTDADAQKCDFSSTIYPVVPTLRPFTDM